MKPDKGLTLGGRYTLVRRIAIGGMGEVWVANDGALHREVAVKVLRAEYAGNEDFLARLRTEARNSAALSHPNIAQMYDYGEQQESGYLVMELVVGEPMADLLEREPVLPLPRLLSILAQTSRGLHAAHVAGVVHRDIKPGNILLDRSGEVKITDFGVSLAANQIPMTATGMVMGTAQYLSPEQAIGQAATGASDIYALGIVAYESVAGKRPFTGATPVDIAVAHVNEKVPPLPGGVDTELAAIIMKMLAKDPKRRPRTGASLAQSLDEISERVAHDPWNVGSRGPRRRQTPDAAQAPSGAAAGRVVAESPPRLQSIPIPTDLVAERAAAAQAGPPPPPPPTVAPAAAAARPAAEAEAPASPAAPWQRPASNGARPAAASAPSTAPAAAKTSAPRSYPPRRDLHGDQGGAPSGQPTRREQSAVAGRSSRRSTIPANAPAVRSPHGALRPTDTHERTSPDTAPGMSRAAQREARARNRTSTTTGQRVGGSPGGISWPLVALLGLLVVVLIVTLVGCAPVPGPATRTDADGVSEMTGIVTTSLPDARELSPDDGMMLPIAASVHAPADLTTLKDV